MSAPGVLAGGSKSVGTQSEGNHSRSKYSITETIDN